MSLTTSISECHYALPAGWTEPYEGPPPSDSGRYVLAQIKPADRNGKVQGNVLITAQDMFFTPMPAANVLASYMKLRRKTTCRRTTNSNSRLRRPRLLGDHLPSSRIGLR